MSDSAIHFTLQTNFTPLLHSIVSHTHISLFHPPSSLLSASLYCLNSWVIKLVERYRGSDSSVMSNNIIHNVFDEAQKSQKIHKVSVQKLQKLLTGDRAREAFMVICQCYDKVL